MSTAAIEAISNTSETERDYYGMTATYSPDDNKLRMSSVSRLDKETYVRIKALGFRWAPRQKIFVAPMWTPAREDVLLELCGEIGDEDTSLRDRAAERAERFETYSDKRATDGDRAYTSVKRLTDGIPLGQPILVGHHSERHARKDAERIDHGMRKAVKMWETSEYWRHRAADAVAHALYKELPAVRARRIKTIETDKRKMERNKDTAQRFLTLWSQPDLTHEQALRIANQGDCHLNLKRKEGDRQDWSYRPSAYDALTNGSPSLYAPRTLEEVIAAAKYAYPKTIAWCDRWLTHYNNRLTYERAMLGEQGGTVAGNIGHTFEVGGRVLARGEWVTILRVNRKDGQVTSLTTNAKYVCKVSAEAVQDYQAPDAETARKVAAAFKAPPLCNYPGEGFEHITKAQWAKKHKDYKGTRDVGGGRTGSTHGNANGYIAKEFAETTARHRIRTMMISTDSRLYTTAVYITDLKRTDAPTKEDAPARPTIPAPEPVMRATVTTQTPRVPVESRIDHDLLKAAREQVKTGVQVVSAPQLFPTPRELAERMVSLARPQIGARVLEPSAGTGALLQALPGVMPFPGNRQTACTVVAFEINHALAERLELSGLAQTVICADFLESVWTDEPFDVVLMNSPFENAVDITHIKHALTMLKPGGRLVAICANGPRQQRELKPLIDEHGGTWEDLPPNTFESAGTNVNTALLVIDL